MFRKKSVWLYLLPGLVGLLAFYLVPFVWGIWFSLTDRHHRQPLRGL